MIQQILKTVTLTIWLKLYMLLIFKYPTGQINDEVFTFIFSIYNIK